MQYDANIPIWLQVMTMLQTDIATGQRPPGEKLPSGRDLALSCSINPNTAARVYQELEKTGLCVTRRGLGTFVTEDTARIARLREELARQAVAQFVKTVKELGISPQEALRMVTEEENE